MKNRPSRCPAWQYAIINGVGLGLGMLLVDLVLGRHISSSDLITVTVFAICSAATATLFRQLRLHRRESRQLYSVPGPMLPYTGSTSAADANKPE
jgi:hypothetical protein